MWALVILADSSQRGNPLHRPEILWGTLGLAAALLAGAAVIYLVDKWRKRAAQTDADEAGSLTSFRAMYENGEITEAEYIELRRKLAERAKKPVPAAAGAAGAGAAAPLQAPVAPAAPNAPVPGERASPTPPLPPTQAPNQSQAQPPAGPTPPA